MPAALTDDESNSCREIGVQNETHYLIQYRRTRHPDGYHVDVDSRGSGRYRPQHGYNHRVHPRPHPTFDYEGAFPGKCLSILCLKRGPKLL